MKLSKAITGLTVISVGSVVITTCLLSNSIPSMIEPGSLERSNSLINSILN
jgi:hypothetical protein